MNMSSKHEPKSVPLGLGGWIVVFILAGILGASIWFALYGWNLADVEIGVAGMIALALGVTVSMALGCGLMALVFWSHNHGYDR